MHPSRIRPAVRRASRYIYRATIVLLLAASLLFTPSEAFAQRRKKKEEEGPTEKAYVLPYLIVMMLVGVGIMTVCRPGSRKDRAEERRKDDDD